MRFEVPLDDLFETKSFLRLLRALEGLPEGLAATGRELARRAGVSHPRATAILSTLSDQGVVLARRAPRRDEFMLNRQHVLVERVLALFAWERGVPEQLIEFLREGIRSRTAAVRAAILFGSAVWGEMAPNSDIDLAVLCKRGRVPEVSSAMEDLGAAVRLRFGNRLAPLISETDVSHGSRSLWIRIASEGIYVVGSARAGSRRA